MIFLVSIRDSFRLKMFTILPKCLTKIIKKFEGLEHDRVYNEPFST